MDAPIFRQPIDSDENLDTDAAPLDKTEQDIRLEWLLHHIATVRAAADRVSDEQSSTWRSVVLVFDGNDAFVSLGHDAMLVAGLVSLDLDYAGDAKKVSAVSVKQILLPTLIDALIDARINWYLTGPNLGKLQSVIPSPTAIVARLAENVRRDTIALDNARKSGVMASVRIVGEN